MNPQQTSCPQKRHDELIVQDIGSETIIYDEKRSHAHRLNHAAALVWSHCDGQRTIADLAAVLQANAKLQAGSESAVSEDVVWLALERLEKEHLLQDKLVRPENTPRITRRHILKKGAMAGGMALLVPVVQSIVAPTPAMALSVGCAKRGEIYSPTRPCCPGLVQQRGRCVGHSGQP